MRKMLICAGLVLALAPVAALATPTPAQAASHDCATLRASIGQTAFTQAFGGGANAFGACVSKLTRFEQADLESANSLCRAEQGDANFAATHDGKTFLQFYGTGAKHKNAFGNCVALKARNSSARGQSGMNPARACAVLRMQMTAAVFRQSFGTNANHSNALGKCVSIVARTQSTDLVSAAQSCLTEATDASFPSTHDGKTFQQFYGTNADLSNAFGNCVLKRLQASNAEMAQSLLKAATTCKAMRRTNPATFKQKYGTRPNAFARCVSAQAKLK
jgi:4-alpha-glucanotransferase